MINKPKNMVSISRLCELAGVSRSGYYNYRNNQNYRRIKEEQDYKDFQLILEAYKFKRRHKGAKQIKSTLQRQYNINMNLKKIHRLMKKFNLFCPIRKENPYRKMARMIKTNNYSNNELNRQFKLGPGKVILSDITYLFYDNGHKKAYLSSTKDPFTMQVPAYKLSESLELPFVINTVHMLKGSEAYELDENAIFHTDQGCHYTSNEFRALLASEGFLQSMSRRGNCWDNAPQESFFGHMKDELHLNECHTFEELQNEVDEYMDYYNNYRYQKRLSNMAPNEFAKFINDGIIPNNLGTSPQTPRVYCS